MGKLLSKFRSRRKKGFTLFEVLIVIVILGVLAAIAIPTYHKVIRKSRVSDGLHVLDMLANAQDKYYIKNGHYSQSLTMLNAPVKDDRVANPNSPYSNIETTNFIYDKSFQQHCITAVSRIGGNYTLVKNYKTNDKVVCKGEDCDSVSDYVDEINEEQFNILCPNEIQCDKDQNYCTQHGGLHFWSIPTCDCKCTEEKYNECLSLGLMLDYNTCDCAQIPCDEEGHVYSTGMTNKDCVFTGTLPLTSKGNKINLLEDLEQEKQKAKAGNNRAGGTPGNDPQQALCGWEYYQVVCRNHFITTETHCEYKGNWCQSQGLFLNNLTCQCYKDCDENEKPNCHAVTGGGYTTCDPCPDNPSIFDIIAQQATAINNRGTGSPKGQVCYHCGYKKIGKPHAVCDTLIGIWHCDSGDENESCQEVSGADSIATHLDCDGGFNPGNVCGQKLLNYVSCKQEIEGGIPDMIPQYFPICQLKEESECFDGQTTTEGCLVGQQKTCTGCQWGSCDPIPNYNPCEGVEPLPELLLEGSKCFKYKVSDCLQDPDTGFGYYEYLNETEGLQPDYECETGATEQCYEGGGTSGNPIGERTCEGCKWSDCVPYQVGPCDNTPQLTGQGVRACSTGNGNSKKCGTQRTNKQVCDEITGKWKWDFTDVPCINLVPKPTIPIYYITSDGCLKKEEEYVCNNPSEWTWEFSGWEGNWLPNGSSSYNCSKDHGSIGLNGKPLQNGFWCENCSKYKCPSNSTRNQHNGKCYKPTTGDFRVFLSGRYSSSNTPWWSMTVNGCEYSPTGYHPYNSNSNGLRACKKNENGHYIEDDEYHCDVFADLSEQCIEEEREVIIHPFSGSYLDHCRTSTEPTKVTIDSLSSFVIYGDAFNCFLWYMGCRPLPLGSGRTCDEVNKIPVL